VNHVVVGAILVGFVMAFLVPSATARVACLVPIALGIISAFGVNKRGAFAGMLMITTVQTASIWNVGIKTAAAQNMVAVGFNKKNAEIHHLVGMVYRGSTIRHSDVDRALFRDDADDAGRGDGHSRRTRTDPQVAGRTRTDENLREGAARDLADIAAVPGCRRRLHSFDTSSTTIAAVALMFLPGIGIMTWKEAQPRIPWGTVVLFGIGISVGMALLQTKGASWLANLAVVEFGLKNATALFVLAVLTLFFTLIHLGFGSATALASAMIPIVIAVLQGVATPGINIVGMTMLLQFVVSFGFILVVNAPQPAEERAMTSSIKSYPLVDKVIEIFGDWLKQRQEIRKLRELDAGEFFVHRPRTLRYTRRPRHICPPGPACHTGAAQIAEGSRHR
jgi:solute carrier family 13 (sodium-dependent dicarboxylate transporter), member 2/3/5